MAEQPKEAEEEVVTEKVEVPEENPGWAEEAGCCACSLAGKKGRRPHPRTMCGDPAISSAMWESAVEQLWQAEVEEAGREWPGLDPLVKNQAPPGVVRTVHRPIPILH